MQTLFHRERDNDVTGPYDSRHESFVLFTLLYSYEVFTGLQRQIEIYFIGQSHTSPPGSAKSSGDEGSLTTDETGDKGARKRKAGLKLNQIAARLHEKNSPGIDDVVDTNEEVKREVSFIRATTHS